MKETFYSLTKVTFILFSITLITFLGCQKPTTEKKIQKKIEKAKSDTLKGSEQKNSQSNDIAVSSPPFSDGIFPCMECHKDQQTNPVRRELMMHDDIDTIFSHDRENRWCLDCHYDKNRDSLKLASGKVLDFKESYKLCGQCHGDKYRDWKVGVHGKRTGDWNGKKKYYLCVNCHNPHSPRFKPIKPLPPPVKQEDIHD